MSELPAQAGTPARRRAGRAWVAAGLLLGWAVAAVVVAVRPAVYESTAVVRVGHAVHVTFDGQGPIATSALIEPRGALLGRIGALLPDAESGPRYPSIRADASGPAFVRIVARGPDPAAAQAAASRVAAGIIARHESVYADFLAGARAAVKAMQDELALLEEQLARGADAAERERLAARRTILTARIARFREVELMSPPAPTELAHPVYLPRMPVDPNPYQLFAAATLLGGVSGLLLAFLAGGDSRRAAARAT